MNLLLLLLSHEVLSDSLQHHELQHTRLACSSPFPGACSNSCPLSRWCHPTISSIVVSFSCLQSFLASGYFVMCRLFVSGSRSIDASTSASVLPVNIQGRFPLGWTGWMSLQSKGLSRESSSTPWFKSINSLALSFLCCPALTSTHDYRKKPSFDYMDLCWQSNVSVF